MGYDGAYDDEICSLFLHGTIACSSITLNVNRENSKVAVKKAHSVGMELALHLTLTEGTALTTGKRLPSKAEFWDARAQSSLDVPAIVAEADAQIDLFHKLTGYPVRIINSHNHTHVAELLVEPLARLFQHRGIQTVRIPLDFDGANAGLSPFLQNIVALSARALPVYQQYGLQRFGQYFLGCTTMGRNMDDATIAALLSRIATDREEREKEHSGDCSVELMCHVGAALPQNHEYADDFFKSPDRCHEALVLGRVMQQQHRQGRKMTIVILASMMAHTGNNTTATELAAMFQSSGHSSVCIDISAAANTSAAIARQIGAIGASKVLLLGIHAYRAGVHLISPEVAQLNLPSVLLCGGTDVNEYVKDSQKLQVMRQVVQQAAFVVCFDEYMAAQVTGLIDPALPPSRVVVIPHAVRIPFHLHDADDRRKKRSAKKRAEEEEGEADEQPFFLLPAGIRPVKDVAFLASSKNFKVLVCGPILDKAYADSVTPHIDYIGEKSREETLALMQRAVAVVNTSVSEGVCHSLMEAMELKVLVVARRNSGNASLIQHGKTGYIFDTVEQFNAIAEQLLAHRRRRRRSSNNNSINDDDKDDDDRMREAAFASIRAKITPLSERRQYDDKILSYFL